MSILLKDIASTLNLSMTTVSWVLAGKGDDKNISKATQERILQYAKKMSYKPNLIARSLNTGISKTLGLILPSIDDRFYSQIAKEIELEAEKFGYTLMMCSSESDLERETKMIQVLRAKRVDGIIMAPTKLSTQCIQEMLDDNYPFVLFDRYFAELPTNYVIIDNEVSSFSLVSHLLKKGCRKIALITTNPHLLTLQQRCDGYTRAHKQMGIEIDPRLNIVVEFVGYDKNIVKHLDELFAQEIDIDGFFFISHILAVETLVYMHERGMDVNRFGLACIHEASTFRVLAPKINTSVMPTEAIGQQATRILIEDINERNKKQEKYVIVKKSVVLSSPIHFRD